MKNGFRVMDSDMHVIEPADLWDRYIDPAFSERRPQGASRWPGDMQIEVEGRVMPDPPSGWGKSRADEQAGVYADGYANNFDSGSQLRAMDAEGIDVAILFPSRGLFALALDSMNPELSVAVARAYNLWLSDFCSADPGRMIGAGMVSPFDVESASREAESVVEEMGFRSVFMRPNVVEGRNWYDPYYYPLWETLEGLGVPVGFHEGATAAMNQVGKGFDTYMMHHTCCHPMEMMLGVVVDVRERGAGAVSEDAGGFSGGQLGVGSVVVVAAGRALRAIGEVREPRDEAKALGDVQEAVLCFYRSR